MSSLGCLILHGFAGDVHEVLPLARSLQAQGFVIECPTLEGHGLSRRQLGTSNRNDWLRSAEEAYQRLAMRTDAMVLIGFSMGGLLSLQLASRYPVSQLITLNTPYHYWDLRQARINLRGDFHTHARRYLRGLSKIPLRSMLQFRQLLAETKLQLPQVTCPYLIIQGNQDDTVQAVSAEHLRQSVQSAHCWIKYFPRSGHLLLHGEEADEVINLVTETVAQQNYFHYQ